MNTEQKLMELFQSLVDKLKQQNLTLSSAESCTGGGFGYALTAISGASRVYAGGCITYATEIKHNLLDVPIDIITQQGVYSVECAQAMAQGIRSLCASDIGVSFTGVAGNESDQGCESGTVYIGIASCENTYARVYNFMGDRAEIRLAAIMQGAELIMLSLQGNEA